MMKTLVYLFAAVASALTLALLGPEEHLALLIGAVVALFALAAVAEHGPAAVVQVLHALAALLRPRGDPPPGSQEPNGSPSTDATSEGLAPLGGSGEGVEP